jgi:hypothetical protein
MLFTSDHEVDINVAAVAIKYKEPVARMINSSIRDKNTL